MYFPHPYLRVLTDAIFLNVMSFPIIRYLQSSHTLSLYYWSRLPLSSLRFGNEHYNSLSLLKPSLLFKQQLGEYGCIVPYLGVGCFFHEIIQYSLSYKRLYAAFVNRTISLSFWISSSSVMRLFDTHCHIVPQILQRSSAMFCHFIYLLICCYTREHRKSVSHFSTLLFLFYMCLILTLGLSKKL